MAKYICEVCGYVYDEKDNTPWDKLPEDWVCPLCGVPKSQFRKEEE